MRFLRARPHPFLNHVPGLLLSYRALETLEAVSKMAATTEHLPQECTTEHLPTGIPREKESKEC